MTRARAIIYSAALLLSCGNAEDTASLASSQKALISGPALLWPLAPLSKWDYLADVSGDGKSDAVSRVGNYIKVSESTGTSFQPWTGDLDWLLSYDYQLADVNDDDKADIIGVGPSGDIMVALSTGSAFASGSVWNYWDVTYDHQFADVNDDDMADIIGVGPSGDIMVALSTGSAFAAGSVWQYWSSAYDHHFADVDGDGKADAIGVAGTDVVVALSDGASFVGPALTWASWSTTYTHRFLDIDTDTKSDLVGVQATAGSGNVQVAPSTGVSFSAPISWGSSGGAPARVVDFADVAGDPKIDMVVLRSGSGSAGGGGAGGGPFAAVQLGN